LFQALAGSRPAHRERTREGGQHESAFRTGCAR
jgi:hypothetical protein